jgi:glycosyltransferase involved in cell wall biosynthesis
MLESLAMGKPIITTDTAGCRETIQDTKNDAARIRRAGYY